jgi:hypothetical protein
MPSFRGESARPRPAGGAPVPGRGPLQFRQSNPGVANRVPVRLARRTASGLCREPAWYAYDAASHSGGGGPERRHFDSPASLRSACNALAAVDRRPATMAASASPPTPASHRPRRGPRTVARPPGAVRQRLQRASGSARTISPSKPPAPGVADSRNPPDSNSGVMKAHWIAARGHREPARPPNRRSHGCLLARYDVDRLPVDTALSATAPSRSDRRVVRPRVRREQKFGPGSPRRGCGSSICEGRPGRKRTPPSEGRGLFAPPAAESEPLTLTGSAGTRSDPNWSVAHCRSGSEDVPGRNINPTATDPSGPRARNTQPPRYLDDPDLDLGSRLDRLGFGPEPGEQKNNARKPTRRRRKSKSRRRRRGPTPGRRGFGAAGGKTQRSAVGIGHGVPLLRTRRHAIDQAFPPADGSIPSPATNQATQHHLVRPRTGPPFAGSLLLQRDA